MSEITIFLDKIIEELIVSELNIFVAIFILLVLNFKK